MNGKSQHVAESQVMSEPQTVENPFSVEHARPIPNPPILINGRMMDILNPQSLKFPDEFRQAPLTPAQKKNEEGISEAEKKQMEEEEEKGEHDAENNMTAKE